MRLPGLRERGGGPRELLRDLRRLLGRERCLTDPAALAVYARDASHLDHGRPAAVLLPRSAAEVAAAVRLCRRHRVPWVARGAGTGLAGGALPGAGAIVISLAALDRLEPAAWGERRIRAGAGVVNEKVSRAVRPQGLLFAPDPSSQSAATIGGNVATNAGGPHTLEVGVTLHHVLRLEWVDPAGETAVTGRGLPCERGLDLLPLLVGSEGTLGVVTAADLRLVPAPAEVTTLLAVFPVLEEATRAVAKLLGAGILPAAIEMVDRSMLRAVEQAFRFGFPTDADAVAILDLAGGPEAVAEDAERAAAILREAGAAEVRRAADAAERDLLWRCRKKAFGAVGRLAPSYVTMDVVVPLGRLPEMVRAIERIRREHGVEIATAFHAGDGNLHPGVHYDERDPEQARRARRAAEAISRLALRLGGSITGEHGIGLEKRELAARQLDREAVRLMWGIRHLFDPAGLCNPGKALPPPELARGAAPPPPVSTTVRFASLTASAPAETPLADLQAAALARGLWLPVGLLPGAAPEGCLAGLTCGALVDALLPGPALLGRGTVRDHLLEVWAETGDGRPFKAGAPVTKNVAGYGLAHLLCGAGGLLARTRAVTFQLRPAPEQAALWHFRPVSPPPAADARPRSSGPPALRPGDGDLRALRDLLSAWETSLSCPAFVWDGFEVGRRGLTVLAAGRDRPWDLGRKEEELSAWAHDAGLELAARERRPFAAADQLAAHPALPDWVRRSGDWTVLARLPGGPDWPPAGAGELLLWQASPPLLWVPLARLAPGEGWHADTVLRGGRSTPLPEPDSGVPRRLLAGLKQLFDPSGWLGEPDWLERARERAP